MCVVHIYETFLFFIRIITIQFELIELKKGEIIFWTIEQNCWFLWLTLLQLGKRIILRCLLNQRHHRNTRRFKRLQLRWHNCGSKPDKKKRTKRRLKPSRLQPIKRFLQRFKCFKKNIMLINLLERLWNEGKTMREPPFIFLRYRTLRCW